MPWIHKQPSTEEKLAILSNDSRYDLACACGPQNEERRRRSKDNKWIYPVALPQGGWTFLFKTLVSNQCVNNCKYCPLRVGQDCRRCSLSPWEIVKVFLKYYYARRVSGIFLSSGVEKNADTAMSRINQAAAILRRNKFRGYMHLKVIPGASDAAIRETVSLASAVSINIETAGEDNFNQLCTTKNYNRDIIQPLKFISRLTARGSRFQRVKQTTQFVVGASGDTDEQIVKYSWSLYKQLGLSRVYFSAYQRGLGSSDIAGEQSQKTNDQLLTREHRLYQVDWLVRKYGFKLGEIPFEKDGNLSLSIDPKEMWAINNPQAFPVDVNRADKYQLLRVPGLGQVAVDHILRIRKCGKKIRAIEDIGKPGKLLKKAGKYVKF